ncbi:putative Transposase-associated domain-containing protein [Helianthus anomalus]
MGNVRDWMYKPRRLPEFEAGVVEFLNSSFAKAGGSSQICCPCKKCMNCYWYRRDEVVFRSRSVSAGPGEYLPYPESSISHHGWFPKV